jgi:hypothetical protein
VKILSALSLCEMSACAGHAGKYIGTHNKTLSVAAMCVSTKSQISHFGLG